MLFIHILAAVFAVGRVTEIITQDRITEKLRKRWPIYLLTCSRCVSVWAGVFATFMFSFAPFGNWPFALSTVYLIVAELRSYLTSMQKQNGIRFVWQPSGQVSVDWAGHNPRHVAPVIRQMLSQFEETRNGN